MKLTIKEQIFQVMEWDIPFHLTELMEKTGAEYGTVSKVMDDYMKVGLIERVEGELGVYARYSPKGKLKSRIKNKITQLEQKEKAIKDLQQEYITLANEYKQLVAELKVLEQDEP